jgi:hypothetical protein
MAFPKNREPGAQANISIDKQSNTPQRESAVAMFAGFPKTKSAHKTSFPDPRRRPLEENYAAK